VEQRRAVAARYHEALADLGGVVRSADPGPAGHSWNQYVVRVPACPAAGTACGGTCTPSADSSAYGLPEARCRDWLQAQLRELGIHTIIYYPIPIHRQPAYAALGYGPGSLPITERLCSEVLSLPIFPELGEARQEAVIAALRGLAEAIPAAAPAAQPLGSAA
jgi:dTDP-4-amino-4,6-dideoxygalactose transaminase